MMEHKSRYRKIRGMSLVELLVVAAITLTSAAVLLPSVMTSVYNMRLRAAANDVAGLLQQAHFRAIRDNTYYPVCYAPSSSTTGNTRLFYVDVSAAHNCTTNAWSSSSFLDARNNRVTYPTVQLSGNVARQVSGTPDTTTMALNFTPVSMATVTDPAAYFSSRGTPCAVSGSVCSTSNTSSYQVFLTDTRASGSNGWAAITVYPTGKTKVWMWTGSRWQ